MTIKYKGRKLVQITHMTCFRDQNSNKKVKEKLLKCQQLAYEAWKRRPAYRVEVILVVIGCMGGGAHRLKEQIARVLETGEKEMTRT